MEVFKKFSECVALNDPITNMKQKIQTEELQV